MTTADFLLKIFVALIPFHLYFGFRANLTLSVSSILAAVLFARWIFSSGGAREALKKPAPTDIPLILFIAVLFAGIFFSSEKLHSVKYAVKWTSAMLVYFFVSTSARDTRRAKNLILISAAAATVLAAAAYFEISAGFDAVYNIIAGRRRIFSLFMEPDTLDYKMKTLSMNWLIRQPDKFGIRAFGLFTCAIVYSAYIGLHLPMLFSIIISGVKKYRLWAAALLANLGALFLTFTRSALVGLAASFAAMTAITAGFLGARTGENRRRTKRILLLTVIFAAGAAVVFTVGKMTNLSMRARFMANPPSEQITERLPLWKSAAKIIRANPVFGAGTANYDAAFRKYAGAQNDPAYYRGDEYGNKFFTPLPAHNQYLSVWAENGAAGLVVYMWLMASLFVAAFAVFRRGEDAQTKMLGAGFIGVWTWYCAQSVFVDLFYAEKYSMLFWCMAGICAALYRRLDDKLQCQKE